MVAREQTLVYTGKPEDVMGDLAEQLRIGQLAFDGLTVRGFNIKDDLRVLVEREGDMATVTLENPLLRDRTPGLLTADYTMQIILNSETEEILSALMGN